MKLNIDLSGIVRDDIFETFQYLLGQPKCKIKRQTASTIPSNIVNPFNQENISTEIEVRCLYTDDKIAVIESDRQLGASYEKLFYILKEDLHGYVIDNTHIIEFKGYKYKIKSINDIANVILEIRVE